MNDTAQLTIALDVNRTHKNKTGYDASPYDFNCSFKTENHTTETFLRDVVAQGWPYTMAHAKRSPKETGADARNVKTPKHGENFTSIQIITGDDDRGQAKILQFWQRDPFFAKWGFALVESVNSKPDAEKCHPVWVLDIPVLDYELARECLRALWDKKHGRYPFMDSSIDPTNTIYNADGGKIHSLGNILPWKVFEREVLTPYRERTERERVAIPAGNGSEVNILRKSQYWQQALQSAADVIRGARDGEKHAELLKASRLLGGYIAGGMGSEGDARALLVAEIGNKGGVKDLRLAEQTIDNGLMYGAGVPISYDAKEGERAEWMRLHGRVDVAEQIEAPPLQDSGGAMGALAELKKRQDAWISSMLKTPSAPEPEWFALLVEIIQKSKMTEPQIDLFLAEVEAPPTLLKRKKTALKNKWRATRTMQAGQQILSAANVGERPTTWPYDVKAGRLVYLSEPKGYEGDIVTATPIADFRAKISHEITREGGDKLFVVDGLALRGGPFCLEIAAEDFGSDNKLRAKLDAASGSLDPVRARMGNHLGPSIKLLTKQEECKKVKRYERTGWLENGRFLIPGRPQPGIEILLKRKLPYRVDADADLRTGLKALDSLLESMTPERASVVAAVMFQAPLARLAGWANERYAMFVAGRSGSLKTTFAQTLFCIYGPDFTDDTLLTKWGEGATNNALMGKATIPHDMPFLIDNYKPGTGGGSKAFVGLIHNIVEGGEKERMSRSSELKDTKPLYCWPICTGEDVPDTDPASLARILVMPFLWQSGEDNEALSKAQALSPQMCAIGNTWIAWLETDDAQDTIGRIAGKFKEYRSKWAAHLRGIRKDSVNILRVASNLATNELTWEIMCEHPNIGELARKHKEAHGRGLAEIIATTMAEATAEALEATRYLSALKELVAVEQVSIPDMNSVVTDKQKYNLIGWQDVKGVYLMPGVARRAVEGLVGDLNGISSLSLNKQLSALGVIASTNKGRYTKNKRINGKVEQILHLRLEVLVAEESQTGAEIAEEMDF